MSINYGKLADTAFLKVYKRPGFVSEHVVYFYNEDGSKYATSEDVTPFITQFNLEIDAYNALEYQRVRKAEYPELGEQLDDLWHMMDQEVIPGKGSNWYNKILQIKNKHPKPK